MSTPETYTFMCDLDRNLPEVDRAAITMYNDGEHIAVSIHESNNAYAGTVFLAYPDAANLGRLAGMLAEDDDPPIPADGNAVAGCMAALCLLAMLVAVVALAVALVS